jgi:uncharacterized cofD-like protein
MDRRRGAGGGKDMNDGRVDGRGTLWSGPPRKVVVIGGGTGSYNVLAGLRRCEQLRLTSIVTMTDSGGDSGRLRSEFKVLPPGDIRRCLVALSEDSSLLRELFNFRFDDDPLRGRQLGNLLVLALARILGSEREAINAIHRLLNIRGRVLPVSWDQVHLCAELADGQLIEEEAHIDVPKHDPSIPIRRVFLRPEATPNPEALAAIGDSDFIVLAPGDLYTSSLPNLLVTGVPEALRRSRARLVYVVNLMTKRGETLGYPASRHVEEIIRYGGRIPDSVLVHRGDMPDDMARRYLAEEARPVEVDEAQLHALGVPRVWPAPVISSASKARHDPERTCAALLALFGALEREREAGRPTAALPSARSG